MRQSGLSRSDYAAFLEAAESKWNPAFGPGDPCTKEDYILLSKAYWETGAHAEVLCRTGSAVEDLGPEVTPGPCMVWKRPKTGLPCKMPVSDEVGEWLADDWIPREQKPHPSTVSRNFSQIGNLAGLGDVTCKTFRYSRGYIVYRERGPREAQNALGVSDKMLKHYIRASDLDDAEGLRELL